MSYSVPKGRIAPQHRGASAKPSLMNHYAKCLTSSTMQRQNVEHNLVAAKQKAEIEANMARNAQIAAEESNRAKTIFLANMSHELRTPLNAIIGFSELINLDIKTEPKLQRYFSYINDIFQSGQHLLAIINDILDIAKIESGTLELFVEPVNIQELILSSVAFVDKRLEESGITLENNIAEDLPKVSIDVRKIRQVLVNLLANSIKFTKRGGTITVSAELHDQDHFCISVCDNGIGMKPEQIPTALEVFQQVDGDIARRFEGTGLGLPISKALIELHKGEFMIESTFGRGTIVSFIVPIDPSKKPELDMNMNHNAFRYSTNQMDQCPSPSSQNSPTARINP